MKESTRPIPELLVEQLLLDELPSARRVALEREFGAEAVQAVLQERRAQDEHLRTKLPMLRAHRHLLFTTPRSTSLWMRINPLPLAALGAALLAVFFWPANPPGDGGAQHGVEETRIKGQDPSLLVFRKVGQQVQMLKDSQTVARGDVLQVAYVAAAARYGVVASVDGRGEVTIHFPAAGESTALSQGKVLLDHAYELDDAPSFERFVFLTGAEPFDIDAVRTSLAASAPATPEALPTLPTFGKEQHLFTFLLRKQEAP